MRSVLIASLASLLFLSCSSEQKQQEFTVDGKILNSGASMVYLQESPPDGAPLIVDSSTLAKDGSYSLTTQSGEESIYMLRTANAEYPFAVLVNDEDHITVNADLNNKTEPYTVKGSPASQGIIEFDKESMIRAKKMYDLSMHVDSLMKNKAADSVIAQPFSEYEAETSSLKEFVKGFIEKANSPILALYALGGYQRLSSQMGIQGFSNLEAGELIRQTSAKFPKHTATATLARSQKSRQAPDFTQPDTAGRAVSLSSLKGKYVLVDFWASWCKPCREENPNVVQAFNQFKDKNFTILGVSLDRAKEPWLKAIEADRLAWTQVSDLQYWNNAAAALYEVRSIPYNVLVDPQGNIVAENLRGPDLTKKLSEILK